MSLSSTRIIEIDTEQKAYDLLSDLLNDKLDPESVIVDFSSARWANFSLKLEGSEFASSLPSSILRTLVEYQNTLYRAAAYIKNDKLNGNALSDQTKIALELNFKFAEGSTEITAEVIRAITEMVNKVTEGMGPKGKLVLSLSVLLLFFGCYTVPRFLDHEAENRKAEIESLDHKDQREHDLDVIKQLSQDHLENQKILSQAYEQQPKLAEMQKEIDQARIEILRQASRAETITIQGAKVDGEVARTITEKKRRTSGDIIIRARFKVDGANDAAGTAFNCKLINVHTGEVIQASMLDALMSESAQAVVFRAFQTRALVDLEIHARKTGTKITKAKIVSAKFAPPDKRASNDAPASVEIAEIPEDWTGNDVT